MDLMTVDRREGLSFDIRVRGHGVTCDLSRKAGGLDHGPTPAELLAGSLGACIAMSVQGYCERHRYEGDVGVSLTIQLTEDPKRVERIVLDVEPPASVPDNKKDAIRRVAERCPIHETLMNPPDVDIDVL